MGTARSGLVASKPPQVLCGPLARDRTGPSFIQAVFRSGLSYREQAASAR